MNKRWQWAGGLMVLATIIVLGALTTQVRSHGDHGHTPLQESMAKLNSNLRQIKKQLADKALTPASADLLVEMQQATIVARQQEPPAVKDVPAAQREAFVRGYRLKMVELHRVLLEMEAAALGGKSDAVAAGVRQLDALTKEGHKTYNP